MATKGTVFSEFIKSNSNFKDKFKGLLDKFLSDLGDGMLSKKLLGDITIKDLTSFLGDVKSGAFLSDLQKGVLAGLDQFKELASDSLGALYTTGLGFAKNMLGSYIDAIMSQVYVPEEIFLYTVQELKKMGSDPNYGGTLRTACLQRDLFRTIEWLDNYNGTTYDYDNSRLVSDGIAAGKYGSYRVAMYIMDKIQSAQNAYSRIPCDPRDVNTMRERKEALNTYNYNLHLVAKSILMGSYDNFEMSTVREMFKRYNLYPSVFGKKDVRFGGRVKINMNDINRAAPIYNKGSIAILHQRFKRSYKTTYICPRNHSIKFIYIYLSSKDIWGEERLWHPELHERLKGIIISTHLKNLSDASTSLLTTGLGKFIQDPQNVIDVLIAEATKKTKPFLFDPAKQIYIRMDDTTSIPDVTEPGKPQPGKNPDGTDIVDPNVIGGIDMQQFRVYTYEDINGDTDIDNIEFQNRIIDRVFTMLKSGYYKRYDIQSIVKRNKIYDASGVFTGSYETTIQDFYIFSTFDKKTNDPILSPKTFNFLIMKYLVDTYGRDRVDALQDTYALEFGEFLKVYDAHVASIASGVVKSSAPRVTQDLWFEENKELTESTEIIKEKRSLINKSQQSSGLTDEQIAKYKEEIAKREIKLFEILHSMRSKVSSIKTPSSVRIIDVFSIYRWMKSLSKMRNNGDIENKTTNDEIIQYQKDVDTMLNMSGKRVGVIALSSIEDVEEQINENPSLTDSSCIRTLISSLRDLLLRDDPNQMTADMPQRVTALTKSLKASIATTPLDLTPETKAALIETLDGLSMSLSGDARHLSALSPANKGAIESQIKVQKPLILRGGKRDMSEVFAKLEGIPGSPLISASSAIAEIQALRDQLIAGPSGLMTELLKYVTNGTDQVTINNQLQTFVTKMQTSITNVTNYITTNATAFNAGNATIIKTAKNNLINELNTSYFKETRALIETSRSVSLSTTEPVCGVIAQLSSVFIGDQLEKKFNTINYNIFEMVKAGPVGGVPVSTALTNAVTSAKNDSLASLNTITTSINTLVTDSTIAQLIQSYIATIQLSVNTLFSFAQSFITANATTFNTPSNPHAAKTIWDQNVGTMYTSTVESIDNTISNIQNVVQTTFTAAEMKEVANSIRLTQQTIYNTINNVQADSSTDELKASIDELNTLIDSLQILATRVSRTADDEYIEEEEETENNTDPGTIITPGSTDPTDDFYMDSGFTNSNRPTEGPLSTEEEEQYKKMMTSGGDVDIDDPESYQKMLVALYSDDTIANRTYILGPAGLMNYMAG